jgi:hypothetical protein
MSRSPTRAEDFLKAMQPAVEPPEPANPPPAAPVAARAAPKPRKPRVKPTSGLKHFGGLLDDDTLEKVALLRVRLKLDNSELIKHAIEELYSRHKAKRAFGDA